MPRRSNRSRSGTSETESDGKRLRALARASLAPPPLPPRPSDMEIMRLVLLCVHQPGGKPVGEIQVSDTLEDLGWAANGLAVLADRLDAAFAPWRIDVRGAEMKTDMTVADVFNLVSNKLDEAIGS